MRRRSELIVILLVIMMLTLLSGCSSQENEVTVPDNNGVGEVLEGYPISTLPLYEMVKLQDCSFTVRNDDKVNLGRNYYMVSFLSDASLEDASEYYNSLLTEINPDYDAPDFFEGAIGEQMVLVALSESDDSGLSVLLSIGQKKADYVEENPYFSDYPGDVAWPADEGGIFEQTYDKQFSAYEDKISINYLKKYVSTVSPATLTDFYNSEYGMNEDFALTDNEGDTVYFWKNQEYEYQVTINKSDDNTPGFYQTNIIKYM